MPDLLASLATRGRWIFLWIWALLIAGSLYTVPRLEFGFRLGHMLRGDDARIEEVRQFYRTFPQADGHLMIAASAGRPLSVNDLHAMEALAEELRGLPEVSEVISPRLLLDVKLDGFTLAEWARLADAGHEPLRLGDGPGMESFRGQLVSRDLRSAALYLIKERGVRTRDLNRAAERHLETTPPPWEGAKLRLVGADYLLEQMGDLLEDNFLTLTRYELIALLVLVPLFMGSFRRAYLPMAASISAMLFYLAIFVLAGKEFGVLHLAGPGLILIIALADSIHLQQRFDEARADGAGLREALREALRSVGPACVLTSLTTAAGFLSLAVARHEEIFDFGLWCAIGVGVSFFTVILFQPVGLALFPGKGAATGDDTATDEAASIGSRAPALAARPRFRGLSGLRLSPPLLRRAALPVGVVLALLAAGVFRTTLDSSLERELPEDVPAVRNANWFAEHFRGLDRIEVDLKADLRDPEVFSLVERIQDELRGFPGISGSRSYVDAVHASLAPDVIETESGPMLGAQALGTGGGFPSHLLTRDLRRACIVFYRTRDFGTEAYEAFRDRIAEFGAKLPEGSELAVTGNFPMYYDSTTLISKTLVASLACSLGIITLILMVVLRSPRLALLCLVPNAVPLLVVAGISGWLDTPIHLGLIVVFSVGLGLAVDDTIHLMVRYQQLQHERPAEPRRRLMDEAIVSTGFAILLTTVVLLIAAACFLGTSFTTMRWTGVTLGIVAVSAFLADLTLLPWLVERFERPLRRRESSKLLADAS